VRAEVIRMACELPADSEVPLARWDGARHGGGQEVEFGAAVAAADAANVVAVVAFVVGGSTLAAVAGAGSELVPSGRVGKARVPGRDCVLDARE